ncbi:ImuA family protein [Devosia sp. Naph2]|uniref:ImuA family protein n=1 Tax=Devosia polycyclovorans TaxID=3345148 RepID=UPI0035D084DC
MQTQDRQQRLAALRDTIADIERKPALAEARQRVASDHDGFPELPGGLLQEVYTDQSRNAGAALGFALAQAKALLTPRRMAVLYLQLAGETQNLGLPYGPGLVSFGFDPAALVLIRPANMSELLWAAEEALACRAVAAVIADICRPHKALDFTASRRLGLRAAEAGSSMFFLRYGTERQASAAHLRWHLMPGVSTDKSYDDRAPGNARWQVRLERGSIGKQHAQWMLEWTENGLSHIPSRPDVRPFAGSALPRPVPALLADGLSQTA